MHPIESQREQSEEMTVTEEAYLGHQRKIARAFSGSRSRYPLPSALVVF